MEVDSLSYRLENIKKSFCNTTHRRLRERLIYENKNIQKRLNEILSIAKMIDISVNENISYTKLLIVKSRRTIDAAKIEKNLFFL